SSLRTNSWLSLPPPPPPPPRAPPAPSAPAPVLPRDGGASTPPPTRMSVNCSSEPPSSDIT
ncbi:MAG: hypothetical protein DMF66_17830, partial [Acidobacteria bacterium]